jgi:hypothetical protein
MMDYTPVISVLIGSGIAAASSLLTLTVQNAYQNRRESNRLVFDTAYKDYELRILHRPESATSFPLILAYHREMLRLIDAGKVTPATVKNLFQGQADLQAVMTTVIDPNTRTASRSEGPATPP